MTLWDCAFRDSGSSSSASASGGGRDNDDDDDDGRQGQQQQQGYYNNNTTSGVEEEKKRRDRCTDKEARNALSKFNLALKRSFVGMSTFPISTTTATKTANTNNDDETGEAFFEEDQQQQHQHHQHLEAPSGHFSPLWGLVTRALNISARDSVYVFLLNHAKSVVSAAVRASVMGPYQAQGLLGSVWLRRELERLVDRALEDEEKEQEQEQEEQEEEDGDGDGWRRKVEEAGQGVPAMDIWLGRHELLYSRIFNS